MRGSRSPWLWVRLVRSSDIEVYERIIDLAVGVAEGRIDPFDVDVGKFLRRLKSLGEVDPSLMDLLMLDVRALHGLIMILEAQSRRLRDRGYGLYLNRLLVRMAADKLTTEELVGLLEASWRPIMELEYMDRDLLDDAFTYYNNLIDLAMRGRIMYSLRDVLIDVRPELFKEPIDLEKYGDVLRRELWEVSGGEYIDYFEFILRGDNPILRAYTISFLISDGWIDVKVDRLKKKIFIRPRKERLEFRNPASIVVVMKGGER